MVRLSDFFHVGQPLRIEPISNPPKRKRVKQMLRTLGIVEACDVSSNCGKNARRRLGGKSILESVVRRMTDCQQLDGVVVLFGCESRNKSLGELVPADVPVVFSSQESCLGRFAEVLEKFPTEAAVRIGGGDPFVDPFLVDRLVVTAFEQEDCDYVSYCSRDGQPAILSTVGVYAEWFRTTALRRAARNATSAEDRRHPTRYIYSHPQQFNLRLIPTPHGIDREDVRLTLDIEEDWDNALDIFEAIDPDEVDWQRIANLLDHQPAMRSRMAALNRQHRKV